MRSACKPNAQFQIDIRPRGSSQAHSSDVNSSIGVKTGCFRGPVSVQG